MTRLLLACLLSFVPLAACSSDGTTSDDLSVVLNDTTDNTGKADVIGGRSVEPQFTESRYLEGNEDSGRFDVTEVTDDVMKVSGPLLMFGPGMDALQLTASTAWDYVGVEVRFLLFTRPFDSAPDGRWTPVTLTGTAAYERDPSEDMPTGDPTEITVSYFETVTIFRATNEVTFSSDAVMGQIAVPLPVDDAANAEFAAFMIPVDSGWLELAGDYDYTLSASCDGDGCAAPDMTPPEPPMPPDIFAGARDVTLAAVSIPPMSAPPESYARPDRAAGMNLGGTEFWQRWPGGHSPSFSYSAGTEQGRICMQASAIRWETIMADPPAGIQQVLEQTNWSGSFFNWNDDYTESTSGDASGARLWAWRTGLIKWISQTGRDGTCYLPTLEMLERVAEDCLNTAEGDGEIQGCSAR